MVSDKVETDVPVDGNINKFSVSAAKHTCFIGSLESRFSGSGV